MNNKENELSRYIDRLNAENKPESHAGSDPELNDLFKTVRAVRGLKEAPLPERDYTERLSKGVASRLNEKAPVKAGKQSRQRKWFISTAAVAAVILFVFIFNFISPLSRLNIVNAMEKAYQGVKAYHGELSIVETNQAGNETVQAKLEVWADKDGHYYIKQLEGAQKGLITANNGQKKWQLQADEKEAVVFTAFPDPYRYTFELGNEIDNVKNALETKVVGEDTIAGRKTSIVEITPKGGEPYRLWIDQETKLPLQRESSMQNALQYKVTYTEFETNNAIPKELLSYKLPEGYSEINTNPEQIVNNFEEAKDAAGFLPKVPDTLPEGYSQDSIAVVTDTKAIKLAFVSQDNKNRVAIIERKTDEDFIPASGAVLGKVGENNAEIQSPVQENLGVLGGGVYAGNSDMSSIRWQQDGFEYAVVGNLKLEEIAKFVQSMINYEVRIPVEETKDQFKPQIEVPVDMEIEKNEQKSVDAGHSPWKLDPVFVAQVFVSLKISPEGITGDYPVKYEELKMTHNTGSEAIVEVNSKISPVSKVYLKRLVRQDETGIWTVVGYDPAK